MTMASTEDLLAVLEAARNLLAARENAMLTRMEWDALRRAVDACEQHPEDPNASDRPE